MRIRNVILAGLALTLLSTLNPQLSTCLAQGGVPLWTNRFQGPTTEGDAAVAMAVDGSGNVFVIGLSNTTDGLADYATIKYSNDVAGAPLWTNLYTGLTNGGGFVQSIAVDSSGNVFVTGAAAIGYNSGSGSTTNEYATLAYSNTGLPLWTNFIAIGSAQSITADSSGNVFVTGSGNYANLGYVTIKYSGSTVSAPAPIPLNFQLLGNQLVLSWTNPVFNLQTAPLVTGIFTNLPGASSPYTNPITSSEQYFRLMAN